MASISKRTFQKNGKTYQYWVARVYVGMDPATGKQIVESVSSKSKYDCAEKARLLENQIKEHKYVRKSSETVQEWMEYWVEEIIRPAEKTLTYDTYRSRMRTHIIPALGMYKLTDLNRQLVQRFANDLTRNKNLSPKSVRAIVGVLQAALNHAIDNGKISTNPANRIKMPKAVNKEIVPLHDSDLRSLLSALKAGDVFDDMIMMTLCTGLRRAEICGLDWKGVDLNAGIITVRQQLYKSKTAGAQYHIETAKEDKRRSVAIPGDIIDMLTRRKAWQNRQEAVFSPFYHNDLNLVFTTEDGRYIDPNTFYKHAKSRMAEIGRPDGYVHLLRHTYATLSLREGDDIKTVQDNLGHATAAFTLSTYAHLADKTKSASASRIQNVLDDLGPTTPKEKSRRNPA